MRVLLVEDNVVNQRVTSHMLRRLGIEADLAENGQEALDRIDRATYDVVLMDVMMPVMDGLEATQAIRRRAGHQPRIIAVTANVMPGDRERCLAAGMDDYLPKPVQLDGLSRVLQTTVTDPSTAAAPVATSSIDLTTLRDLRAMIGDDPEFFDGLVSDYVVDADRLVAELRQALDDGDRETARRAAHTLKSSSAMVGSSTVSGHAATLEHALAGPDGSADASTLAALDVALAASRRDLDALRASGFAGL